MCHKNIGLFTYDCHYCNKDFCIHCRLPEDHDCNAIQVMKEKEHNLLSEDLKKKATKDTHHLIKT
jgi:predicted nucleic acid binding AN1-type Zn finger protein